MSVSVRNLAISRVGNSDQYRAGWSSPSETAKVTKVFRATKTPKASSHSRTKKAATKEYKVVWSYDVLDHNGNTKRISQARTTTTTALNDVFNAPSEALQVYVSVTPVSRTYTYYTTSTSTKGKTSYTEHKDKGKWFSTGKASTASKSTGVKTADPPEITSVDVDGRKITVKVKSDYEYIERFCLFVYLNGSYLSHLNNLTNAQNATFVLPDCANSGKYQFKSRVLNLSRKAGEFTELTDVYWVIPADPTRPPNVSAGESGTARVTFDGITSDITRFHVQYASASSRDEAEKFFAQGTGVKSVESSLSTVIVPDLEAESVYYFRYRTENPGGESEGWSPVTPQGFRYGTRPDAPTVWSDKSVYSTTEKAILNWVHNATDDSIQTWWEVGVQVGDSPVQRFTGADQRTSLELDLSGIPDGARVSWNAKTRGVGDDESPPSETVSFMVWDPPQIAIDIAPLVDKFPIEATVASMTPTQGLLLCDLDIKAVYPHEIMRPDGTLASVGEGDVVFSSHDAAQGATFSKAIDVGDLLLADSQDYEISATCAMNSGLTATCSTRFLYDVDEAAFSLGANILEAGDKALSIAPYALFPSDDGSLDYAESARFSIFRFETNGAMTALVKNMPNDGTCSYIDHHAALSRQSYRVVAIDAATGLVSYEDFVTELLSDGRLIFSWDEDASIGNGLLEEEPTLDGNVVEVPYDIEVQENHSKDKAGVEYIGKTAPSSRYGTQLGETATWTCSIPRDDLGTLAALRRVANLMRDVYVREPLGSAYYAMVDVNFHARCDSAKIDVTIDVTRTDTTEECVVM